MRRRRVSLYNLRLKVGGIRVGTHESSSMGELEGALRPLGSRLLSSKELASVAVAASKALTEVLKRLDIKDGKGPGDGEPK